MKTSLFSVIVFLALWSGACSGGGDPITTDLAGETSVRSDAGDIGTWLDAGDTIPVDVGTDSVDALAQDAVETLLQDSVDAQAQDVPVDGLDDSVGVETEDLAGDDTASDTTDTLEDTHGSDSLPDVPCVPVCDGVGCGDGCGGFCSGCDDGNPCSGPDLCEDGLCTGVLKPLGEITLEDCVCATDEDCQVLDDGDLCNGTLFCAGDVGETGLCAVDPQTVITDCDDSNECTMDGCDPQTGCVSSNVAGGTPCGDPSGWGTCQGGDCICTPSCQDKACGDDGCGLSCGDCSPGYDCLEHECVVDCDFFCADIPCGAQGDEGECDCGQCDDQDPCTVDSCDQNTASCVFDAWAGQGLNCEDNLACTVDDECTAQGCKGTPVVCDDGNPCTLGSCSPLTGACSFGGGPLQGTNCDDGNPCTSGDKCAGGECVGILKPLDQINVEECPCGADEDCDPLEDTDICTGALFCLIEGDSGTCHVDGESVPDCDDAIECTIDACDPLGGCQHTPFALPCVDQASCTVDSCDPIEGCLNTPDDSKCDDGNPCTVGFCDPSLSCVTAALGAGFFCGDPEGWGTCQGGQCACAPKCDGKDCGDDGCGGSCGVCASGYTCVEQLCEADCDGWCYNRECGPAALQGECDCGSCEDDSSCTTDLCLPDGSCKWVPLYGDCDDGDGCTTDDHCAAKTCIGTPVLCDDEDPCTADSCDSATGLCEFDAAGAQGLDCDDGIPCTHEEVCDDGTCVGTPKACDDSNPCTLDTCDEATGVCLHTDADDLSGCDDGNPCTGLDQCSGGECAGVLLEPGVEVPEACGCLTDDDCLALEDGDLCNGSLYCDLDGDSGICDLAPESVPDCDDGIGCSDDLCDPEVGCLHLPVDEICGDDIDCTDDFCHLSAGCYNMPWGPRCDDGNDCTSDICYNETGCSYTALQNTIPCGEPDGWGNCQGGQCSCNPQCAGLNCGPDGCGGTCGTCQGALNECVFGTCECVPDCGSKTCGINGCGGWCGFCDPDAEVCGPDLFCHCAFEVCNNFCCTETEACIDDWCQEIVNPPPVKITFGEITTTSLEIIMENDVPISCVQLNTSLLDLTWAGGGLIEEYGFVISWVNIVQSFGFGSSIPPGKGVLLNLEFEEQAPGSGIALIGDTNVFCGPDGIVEYQVIPPYIFW
ncbi:MAG: hypothetical protein ABIK09_15365 [Pseudomonadota bacterium]